MRWLAPQSAADENGNANGSGNWNGNGNGNRNGSRNGNGNGGGNGNGNGNGAKGSSALRALRVGALAPLVACASHRANPRGTIHGSISAANARGCHGACALLA